MPTWHVSHVEMQVLSSSECWIPICEMITSSPLQVSPPQCRCHEQGTLEPPNVLQLTMTDWHDETTKTRMVHVLATLLHLPNRDWPVCRHREQPWTHRRCEQQNRKNSKCLGPRLMDRCGDTSDGSMWSEEEHGCDLLIQMFGVQDEWVACCSELAPGLLPMWFLVKSESGWPLCDSRFLLKWSKDLDAENDGSNLRKLFSFPPRVIFWPRRRTPNFH